MLSLTLEVGGVVGEAMGQSHAVQNLGNLPPMVGLVQKQKFEGRPRRGVPKVADRILIFEVIIPATVFSGSSFRQMMGVRKLPAVDSDSSVLLVFGMGVFHGGHHYGRLSLIGYTSQSAVTVAHLVCPAVAVSLEPR